MSDEWDDLILQKQPVRTQVNLIKGAIEEAVREQRKDELLMPSLKKKESAEPAPVSAANGGTNLPSPYVSILPSLPRAKWAEKLAMFGAALMVVYGIYAYASYISDFGFSKAANLALNEAAKLSASVISALGF